MNLDEYFEKNKGIGILATSDSDGNVDMAVYSRPHIIDDKTIAFIMGDRLSHANLQSNPKASYLFREDGDGYNGKRLYLIKINEEKNSKEIEKIRRKKRYENPEYEKKDKFLVYFKINKIRPLVGDD